MIRANDLIEAFPIATSAFGLRPDWLPTFASKLIGPAYILIILFLVAYVGIMVLKRFEHVDLSSKAWNFPILMVIIAFWPTLVLGLKDLVDTFNTFLVQDIFKIPWNGFGFPSLSSFGALTLLPSEGLARLLPNLAYWIIYAFFMIFFFFYSVLGPIILAKGVLYDEMESFFALAKELVILLLWQSSLIVIVAFIMPDIVSGKPFPPNPPANFYFLSIILGIMIFFIPPLTRKFAAQMGGPILPAGFRWGGAGLAMGLGMKLGGSVFSAAGVRAVHHMGGIREKISKADLYTDLYRARNEIYEAQSAKQKKDSMLRDEVENEENMSKAIDSSHSSSEQAAQGEESSDNFLELSKTAKKEIDEDESPSR